ncbi:type II toxin-antitoxin system RelB/DinJ family antitoxin [Bradyrhizobium diazoefficiens]|nr:type II toxin-antitoxin system RelB/DinJ family antitoxin [Bradyrhizobium diazoefficiens]MBR0777930.1 type II toxin-antitoxin system RelB/DinJ family antitoxin [Bradyrhizobium diazoefficiens]
MGKTAYLNARIDPTLKNQAEKVLAKVGVSTSQAITMFYRQVVLRKGLPFDVCIPNEETVEALKEAEAGGGQLYHGLAEDVFAQVLNED